MDKKSPQKETRTGCVIFAICFLVVIVFLALGLYSGFYLAKQTIESARIVQWNWYQAHEGPDMGTWKQGSSGGGAAIIIILVFSALGSALGLGLGLCIKYLIEKCIYPLIARMKTILRVLVVIFLILGFCGGFYLGHTIAESAMIVNWMAYDLRSWGAWRYESSWGAVPVLITVAFTTLGSALGLGLGLCVGYLIEGCTSFIITKQQK